MQVTKNEINEILGLYEKYCKVLDLLEPDKLPPLTLNESEYMTALIDPYRQKRAKRTIKKALGQTSHKWNGYNHVILVNVEKMKYMRGLHQWSEPREIRTKRYIKTIISKIPHLEETLIHELVHVKHPELRHGKRFNQIVRNIYLSNNRYDNEKQNSKVIKC